MKKNLGKIMGELMYEYEQVARCVINSKERWAGGGTDAKRPPPMPIKVEGVGVASLLVRDAILSPYRQRKQYCTVRHSTVLLAYNLMYQYYLGTVH